LGAVLFCKARCNLFIDKHDYSMGFPVAKCSV
jgi:hypothetical protein